MALAAKKKRNGEYHATIRDIFVCSKAELTPFSSVFVYPPENFEQQKFGTLFGIIKVDDHSENSSYVANLLASQIKKEYFGKLHRSPEESFEASLRKANLALAELARHGTANWAGKINFVGGAVERNNLHFACLGNVSVFLVRGNEIAEISQELDEEKESEPHPLKTFSNISSGKLEIGDKLIFTTSDLIEIFSPEELRQNSSHFSKEEFPEFLEVSLKANSLVSGTIIIDLAKTPKAKPLVIEAPLIGQEKIKRIDSFVGADEIPPSPKEETDFYGSKPDIEEKAISTPASLLKKTGSSVKKIFSSLSSGLNRSFSRAREKAGGSQFRERFSRIPGRARAASGKVLPAARSAFSRVRNNEWTKQKGNLSKIIAIAVIVVLGIYGVTAYVKNRNAQRLSQEAEVSSSETESIPQIIDDINVKEIGSIDEVATLTQQTDRIVFFGESVYAVPQNGNSILKVDLGSQNVEETPTNANFGNFKLAAAMPNLNSIFILTEGNKLISFTPINKKFQENGIALPGNLKASDMKTYLTYLYFLDAAANQVYRYPRAEGGFGEMQNWLRSGEDIKNSIGFAINDDLFTASPDGITAYLQGKKDEKTNFENPNVTFSISKIYSEPDMEGVYVLDNKNHRIARYGKDGKILAQYWNADISGASDFVVDENNKVVYLLKSNQLLKFNFE